jgi:hypothetical protein
MHRTLKEDVTLVIWTAWGVRERSRGVAYYNSERCHEALRNVTDGAHFVPGNGSFRKGASIRLCETADTTVSR